MLNIYIDLAYLFFFLSPLVSPYKIANFIPNFSKSFLLQRNLSFNRLKVSHTITLDSECSIWFKQDYGLLVKYISVTIQFELIAPIKAMKCSGELCPIKLIHVLSCIPNLCNALENYIALSKNSCQEY